MSILLIGWVGSTVGGASVSIDGGVIRKTVPWIVTRSLMIMIGTELTVGFHVVAWSAMRLVCEFPMYGFRLQ